MERELDGLQPSSKRSRRPTEIPRSFAVIAPSRLKSSRSIARARHRNWKSHAGQCLFRTSGGGSRAWQIEAIASMTCLVSEVGQFHSEILAGPGFVRGQHAPARVGEKGILLTLTASREVSFGRTFQVTAKTAAVILVLVPIAFEQWQLGSLSQRSMTHRQHYYFDLPSIRSER